MKVLKIISALFFSVLVIMAVETLARELGKHLGFEDGYNAVEVSAIFFSGGFIVWLYKERMDKEKS